MPDNTARPGTAEVLEMWKQWSDTTARIWKNLLAENKEAHIDPYGLYQTWLKAMNEYQEQMKAAMPEPAQATDALKQWTEGTNKYWSEAARNLSEAQASSTSMYQMWLKGVSGFQEQARSSYTAMPNAQESWKQWTEGTTKAWTDALAGLSGGRESYTSPLALYQTWMKSMGELQEQMKMGPSGMPDPKEVWRVWFDRATDLWRKAAESGPDPLGLTSQWLEMLEETRAKMQATGSFPSDPFSLYKQWYDATSETWAKIVEELIGTDKFMESASQFLDSYTSFASLSRRANEDYFHNLQLPTRSDIARVASLVIALEDKVDGLEDSIEALQDKNSHARSTASTTALHGVEHRLHTTEQKLDAVQAAQVQATTEFTLLEQRLGRVEGKLDLLLSTLEKIEIRGAAEGVKPATESRRKSSKVQSEHSVNGSISEGEAFSSEAL